jgi:endonuclease-3 related protein
MVDIIMEEKEITISKFYDCLLNKYGHQGWWPLMDIKGENPTKTGSIKGYHPNNYDYPKSNIQRFEICVGAILTQNTSWENVEKALLNMKKHNLINPNRILNSKDDVIKDAIKPTGYFNQKTRKLREFSKFYIELNDKDKSNTKKEPTREELLKVWGIGKETADSILLYAYKKPVFVVDTYTKRIFKNIGWPSENYDIIQDFIHKNFSKDYRIYQEFHALLVEHAKRYYSKKPYKRDICYNK